MGKVRTIIALWAEQARASGYGEEAGDIDVTYVVDRLLDKATDEELAQWGGNPDTEEKLDEVLKRIRKRPAH